MATAGSIVIDLLMRTGSFVTDSDRASKALKKFEKEAKQAGVAIGAAIGTGLTVLTALTAQAINFADQINDMSQTVGVSTETLSAWGYAAKQSGTDLESLSSALPKLSKNLAQAMDEGSRGSELFKALGIDVKDAAGNLRSVEDVLPEITDRFKSLNNETTEAALAQELFGKSGAQLLQFLNQGSDGLAQMTARAAELGIVIDQDTATAAGEFNDRVDDLLALVQALGLQIADRLLPQLIQFEMWLEEIVQSSNAAGGAVDTLTGFLDAAGGVANFVWGYFKALDDVITGLSAGFVGLAESAKGVINLNWDQIKRGIDLANEGADLAYYGRDKAPMSDPYAKKTAGKSRRGGGPMNLVDAFVPDPSVEGRVNKFFQNVDRSSAKVTKQLSEAERAAKQLAEAFDSSLAGLEQQQYMLGKTGEEARIRYETELGSLKELDQTKKDILITEAATYDLMVQLREESEKKAEAEKQATKAFEESNRAILEQIDQVSMTADEQEIYNNLTWAGVEAESARGKQIIENTQRLQQMREAMDEQIEAMDAVREAGADFLVDLTNGAEPLKSLEDAWDRIHQKILQMISENLMDQLFGKKGDPAGGSSGGWLSDLFGGLFGGGGGSGGSQPVKSSGGGFWNSVAGWIGSFFGGGMASGGDVFGGRPYLVGEQGPEMFVPRTAGSILTAGETAGIGNSKQRPISVIQQFYNPVLADKSSDSQRQQDAARKLRNSTRNS